MLVKVLFEEGIKPAWIMPYKIKRNQSDEAPFYPLFLELKKTYSYIIFEHRNSVLFFNDDMTKEWFEANGCVCFYSQREGRWLQDYKHDILGHVLGFPPSAVESWKNKLGKGRRVEGDRVSVEYYGIQFVCEPHDVVNCLNWLMEFRPVPEHLNLEERVYVGRERINLPRLIHS